MKGMCICGYTEADHKNYECPKQKGVYREEPAQSVCCDKCHGLGYTQTTIKTPADHAPVYVTETQSSILEQLDGLKTNLGAMQRMLTKGFDELKKYIDYVSPETFEHFANVEALLAVAVLRLATLNSAVEKEARK
jgi:hypothetical protein